MDAIVGSYCHYLPQPKPQLVGIWGTMSTKQIDVPRKAMRRGEQVGDKHATLQEELTSLARAPQPVQQAVHRVGRERICT